jgi:hypothetical protein
MLSLPIDLFHNNKQENRNFQHNVKNKSKLKKSIYLYVYNCAYGIWHIHLVLGEGPTPTVPSAIIAPKQWLKIVKHMRKGCISFKQASDKNISPSMLNFSQLHDETHS